MIRDHVQVRNTTSPKTEKREGRNYTTEISNTETQIITSANKY